MSNCPYCGAEPSTIDHLLTNLWSCGTMDYTDPYSRIKKRKQHDSCRIRELEQQLAEAKNVIAAMRGPFDASPGIIHRLKDKNANLKMMIKTIKRYLGTDSVEDTLSDLDALDKEPGDDG